MQKAEAVICLSALAHEQRLAIFRLLVSEGPSGLLAGEIAEAVGATAEASANNRTISVRLFPLRTSLPRKEVFEQRRDAEHQRGK